MSSVSLKNQSLKIIEYFNDLAIDREGCTFFGDKDESELTEKLLKPLTEKYVQLLKDIYNEKYSYYERDHKDDGTFTPNYYDVIEQFFKDEGIEFE